MKKLAEGIRYSLSIIFFVAVGFVLAITFVPQNTVGAIGEEFAPQVGMSVSLSEQERIYQSIYSNVAPSVISITIHARQEEDEENQEDREWVFIGSGSGFVIDENGHILTNNHVIDPSEYIERMLGANAEVQISVTMFDGTVARAEIIGQAPQSDIAVIRVDVSFDRLHPVTFADSEALQEGQFVFALGNPYASNWSLSGGIVSALNRSLPVLDVFNIGGLIQTDAAINPGNSGGPLVNLAGQVVGVNSYGKSRSGGNDGVGFAIPSNLVIKIAPILIRDGEIHHSYLGISILPIDLSLIEEHDLPNNIHGVPINRVQRNGPAMEAGLHNVDVDSLDIITAINDLPIANFDELVAYLNIYTNPGDIVILTVYRNGEIVEIPVTLTERPS